jgi:hypothetical protein
MVVVILLAFPPSEVRKGEGRCKHHRSWDLHRQGTRHLMKLAELHGFSWPDAGWIQRCDASVSGQIVAATLCSDFACYPHRGARSLNACNSMLNGFRMLICLGRVWHSH